jgi:hypothetical protein
MNTKVLVYLDKRTRYCSRKLAGGLFVCSNEFDGLHVWKGKYLTVDEFNADMKTILGHSLMSRLGGEIPKVKIIHTEPIKFLPVVPTVPVARAAFNAAMTDQPVQESPAVPARTKRKYTRKATQ